MTEVNFAGVDAILRPVDGMLSPCVLGGGALTRLLYEAFKGFELRSVLGLGVHLRCPLGLGRGGGHAFIENRDFLPCVLATHRLVVEGIGFLPYVNGRGSGRWFVALIAFALLATLLLLLLVLALLLVLTLLLIPGFIISICLIITILLVVLTFFAILLFLVLSISIVVFTTFVLLILLISGIGIVGRFLLLINLVGVAIELLERASLRHKNVLLVNVLVVKGVSVSAVSRDGVVDLESLELMIECFHGISIADFNGDKLGAAIFMTAKMLKALLAVLQLGALSLLHGLTAPAHEHEHLHNVYECVADTFKKAKHRACGTLCNV